MVDDRESNFFKAPPIDMKMLKKEEMHWPNLDWLERVVATFNSPINFGALIAIVTVRLKDLDLEKEKKEKENFC